MAQETTVSPLTAGDNTLHQVEAIEKERSDLAGTRDMRIGPVVVECRGPYHVRPGE